MECHFKKQGKLKINKYQLRCVEDARGKYRNYLQTNKGAEK